MRNLSERELLLVKEIGPIHSMGLDSIYEKIVSESKLKNRSYHSFDKSTYISFAVEEFMEKDNVVSKISKYENLPIKYVSEKDEKDDLKRAGVLFPLFENFWRECDHKDLLKSIDQFMGSSDVIALNSQDREVLFLGLSIYYDSFNYWSNNENRIKWDRIKNRNSARGLWGDICTFASEMWDAVEPYAVADGKGAIAFGIGGGTGGTCVGGGFLELFLGQ